MWGLSHRAAEALIDKETLGCWSCGAKLRSRRLAHVLLDTFAVDASPPASAREWAMNPIAKALRVAEINRIEGLHEAMGGLPLLSFSDFREGPPAPLAIDGVSHEDLMHLSYADSSFDLVLTSETLEHVPDLDTALSEIRRILVPGGRHLFTVPIVPGVEKTYARMSLGPDGELIYHATPIRHPGGDWGYPVFTEFGADLPEILDRAGFDTTVHFGPMTEDDIAQVFACRRR